MAEAKLDGVQDIWVSTEIIFHMDDAKKKPDVKALREVLKSSAKGKIKGDVADIDVEQKDSYIL